LTRVNCLKTQERPMPAKPQKIIRKKDADQGLVDRGRKGDTGAFDELVLKYQKKVIGLCFRHLNQYEDACDLAQEVFVTVYHNLAGFKGQSSFSTWLYRVTLNACYNRQKFLAVRGKGRTGSLEGMLEKRELDPGRSILLRDKKENSLERLVSDETSGAVREKINQLTDEFRRVIELVDLEEFSYEEAADILDVPVNTVRSRLSRARQALKRKLKGLLKD
jgi:RNA polymerase sigma-70 factor, ECF subfamily